MKIVIATGIYPPEVGGPAYYAHGLAQALSAKGHEVSVVTYGTLKKLPTGIRHLAYFLRLAPRMVGADAVIALDTFSVAVPASILCRVLHVSFIIRTGGDFLWEQYVERTGDLVLLRDFYTTRIKRLNQKERIIFRLVQFLFHDADAVIFSTEWQRDIFEKPYKLNKKSCFIVENYYGTKTETEHSNILENVGMSPKVFVGGTRELKWKNLSRVEEAFTRLHQKGLQVSLQLQTGSRGQFLMDIQSSYAVVLASLGDVSPNTILEAIEFGKPFILTRETGLYEKLKDIGVWVDPESIDDIAAKIEWLSDEKNYEIQRKKVEAFMFTHSWEEIANEIFVVFRSMEKL